MVMRQVGRLFRVDVLIAGLSVLCAATARAATAPDFVTNEAVFWLDASALTETAGTELDSWADVRGGSYPSVTTYTTVKPQVIEIADGPLTGKKAVTFFTVGTKCDMKFAANQTVRTAFFVTDIDQSADAYLLGSSGDYYFARGTGGSSGTVGSYKFKSSALNGVDYWNDGVKVADPTATLIPTGYQLITWCFNNGTKSAPIIYIGQDRSIAGRIGGKRLCEVVAFSRVLSDVERSYVEGYLKAKWFGAESQVSAALEMVGKKAQVHFDASVASSFHYEVDGDATGTLVSQWDDISGNGRHFMPFHGNASSPRFGTRDTLLYAPVYNSGSVGSGVDLKLETRLTNTRTVFMVADVDRHWRTYWLGDASSYDFARGQAYSDYCFDGAYAHRAGGAKIQANGSIYRNGMKIEKPLSAFPDPPGGGLSVFSFVVAANCSWQYLATDRNNIDSSGGKRVAELLTFSTTFSDNERMLVEKLLMEKWRPSEAYVDALVANAVVHADASAAANFNYTDGRITGWKNQGDGSDLVKPYSLYRDSTARACQYGSYGFTNGVPAFLMGETGSDIDLIFSRNTKIRSVFWAMDIDRDSAVFFLNDCKNENNMGANTYHYCRGFSVVSSVSQIGCYASSTTGAVGYRQGPMFCDGEIVAQPTATRPPRGMHVYDHSSIGDLTASSLSQDRHCYDGDRGRNGGRAISEIIIFTNLVTGLTRDMIRERIAAKWTKRCGWAGAGDAEWGADKYRVFDAATAVPAEGASAVCVGFTASATLSGTGTLTLGDGGIFASEDATATVSAPVAGKLGAYGPGTVNIATVPSTVDSISVGYGSTLVIAAGDTTVSGGLSIQEEGKLVIDVSSLAANRHVAITFADNVLPAGGHALRLCVAHGQHGGSRPHDWRGRSFHPCERPCNRNGGGVERDDERGRDGCGELAVQERSGRDAPEHDPAVSLHDKRHAQCRLRLARMGHTRVQ